MGMNGYVCRGRQTSQEHRGWNCGMHALERKGSPVERELRAMEAIWALGTPQVLGKSPHLSGEFSHQLSRNDGMAFLGGQGCGAGPCR